ncbi:sensor histidine kinase [Desulfitobacterium chlororespirans]|uniref:GHKL domain-containing protein n=1 Tax=Desulfitobacterium chlororespirans DSM 11544 TaxID=1121395 RepID=A0A1M7TZ85_9FIRM|nr:sensor histidine kinase [Desulfitobacterium chlororespirans]SHN75973.1 GHKL domain-containing protein [Desulfitobacterium chlororespirans DSM 11544]
MKGLPVKSLSHRLPKTERGSLVFAMLILLCAAMVVMFLSFYFQGYRQPYLMKDVVDLSEGWQYSTEGFSPTELATLGTGPQLQSGETMTLSRRLDSEIKDAAILIRANHQAVNVYLDGVPLYLDRDIKPGENPGMALHFIPLPEDYLKKTLQIGLTSPYTLYAGRTSPILLGDIPSLEAYALSHSMRSVILMAMCLLIGMGIIALTLVQALGGIRRPQNLAMGVFAVIWALYYVCTEYIVFQFFAPFWVSALSLGLYFTFQVPLTLYFYFSFQHYKKWLLPAVILHSGFAVTAILLQLTGIMDLPRLLNINNILLIGLAYTIVLAILEGLKKNRLMLLAAPFLILAYGSMLYNFAVFYSRHGIVPYTYKDTYFLLILCVLLYNIQQFFSAYYKGRRESAVLTLQNRLAKESYEQMKSHLREVSGLKHEIKNHLAALQTYLTDGRHEEAKRYLERCSGQVEAVLEAIYHAHFLINAVVGNLLRRAQGLGVKVELDLKAGPLHIADHDLYSLLSNMLDNALEACEAMPGGRERFIRLRMIRQEPYLSITCVNSRADGILRENGNIQTTKRGEGHGYGLWTVEKIADTYDGLVDTDYDESTFTITVALKDNQVKTSGLMG